MRRSTRFKPLRWLLLTIVVTGWVGLGRAHGGEDHGAPEPVASDPNLVVRATSNQDYEVVMKYSSLRGQKATVVRVYLSDYATNTPIEGARIGLRTTSPSPHSATAAMTSPGTYEAPLRFEQPGRYIMILAIKSSSIAEFAFQDLPMGEELVTSGPEPTHRKSRFPGWWIVAAVLALLAVTALLIRRRAARVISRTAVVLLVAAGGIIPATHEARAEKEPPTAGPPAPGGSTPTGQLRYMPKESQFFLGIRTVVAEFQTLRTRIRAVGHVVPESGALANVGAPRDGKVESTSRRLVVGDRVREGQLIANLLVIDRLPVRAPISGLVAEVRFTPGQWVQAGDPLIVILDERQVRVELPLFGENLNLALRARTASVTTTALPGMEFPARVRGLAPTASEASGGSEGDPAAGGPIPPVLLTVVNRGGLLRPGMLVEASLELPTSETLIVVPESAVIQQEGGAFVFAHIAPEVFEQRPIRVAGRYGERVGITGAIRAGDRIVVSGNSSLASAPPVQAAAPRDSTGTKP